jgi:ATP-binding cassette, subfamily B, bacterial CvaB/MchF/RaxB
LAAYAAQCGAEKDFMNAFVDMLQLSGSNKTPYIQQNEASECGLACLAMVGSYHGYVTDLASLRQQFSLSLKGSTLKQLVDIADQMGLQSRPVRGDLDDLPHIELPAILHWNLNHFVVLTKITSGMTGKRYQIFDPASSVKTYDRDEMSKHWTGVALELSKSHQFKPQNKQLKLRIGQLWSSMSGFWQTFQQLIFLSLVLQFIALATPFFLQISIDTIFPSFDKDLLFMLTLGFAGLALVSFLTSWLRALVLLTLNSSLSYQVVTNLFRHLARLPLPWFEKRHVGDVISRFGSTRPIAQLLSQGMIAAFIDGIMAVLTLVLMYVYSGVLASVVVVALVIHGLIRVAFLHALKLKNLDVITTAAKEETSFIESVRGISAIKAFGQEGNRQRLWQRKKADAVNAEIKLGRMTAAFDNTAQLIIALERVFFVYIAITLAFNSTLTIGMIFAFQAYKQQFLDASIRLIEQAINYNIIQVHLGRISDIALSKVEDDKEFGIGEIDFSKGIELRDIYFRYGAGETPVIRGISLKIEAGEHIVFVGPSGGGKTTLIKIMMSLFEPSHGEILIGNRPLSGLSKQQFRKNIAGVAQEDVLFAGTLAENVSFFDPEIDRNLVEEVCRTACIWNDIAKLPLGIDSLVGDMGSTLSGGQKQRILIARALYQKPKILFIDEGTAHLDPKLEKELMANLSKLDVTHITIAHRSEAINSANRAFLIANGVAQEIDKKAIGKKGPVSSLLPGTSSEESKQ